MSYLEGLLGAHVHRVKVRKVDLINASTLVEVRYQLRPEMSATAPTRVADTTGALR